MQKHTGFTLIELLIVIGVVGVLASIAFTSMNAVRVNGRDTKRIGDARSILTALESYRDSANKLPDNTDNDADGWDIGNSKQPAGDTFLQPLRDAGTLGTVPIETYWSPATYPSFRYLKYVNEANCGGTYAIFAIRLEGKKDSYKAQNTLETCYTANFNAVPVDDYWLAYMIREF